MKGESKYQPLQNYLVKQSDRSVTLTFDEMEALMADALPDSARQNRAWWSNRSKGALQARSWMNAGFMVTDIDFEQGHVTFAKPPTAYKVERVGDTVKWTGELVKGLRRHMGLTQSEFAAQLGVRQQTISDWETHVYDPRRAMSKYLSMVAEQAGFRYGEITDEG